jgi:hypothetical protein
MDATERPHYFGGLPTRRLILVAHGQEVSASRTGVLENLAAAPSSTSRLTDTLHARAFAFSWSNSAWVIVPASRSCLADAI